MNIFSSKFSVCCLPKYIVRFLLAVCIYLSDVIDWHRGTLVDTGYRMKIGDSDDKANTGRLHVDYAQARDDLYEWECNQRLLARENRHNRQVEDDLLHPPSPPPITHFSDYEASVLLENLKGQYFALLTPNVAVFAHNLCLGQQSHRPAREPQRSVICTYDTKCCSRLRLSHHKSPTMRSPYSCLTTLKIIAEGSKHHMFQKLCSQESEFLIKKNPYSHE